MATFSTILVANRGEIACRVMRTARELGYRTVAVYSDADADAPHVHAADIAVHIGPAVASQSYLDAGRIIEAARRAGADAVHPGYGFLSENAAFAAACIDAGLVFIGPKPETIALMGSKAEAKRVAAKCGVPLLPGYSGPEQSDTRLQREADKIGYPVMVKASAGGGGKGMRLVSDAKALPDALKLARSEALKAFGSEELILERALGAPRHIEVQVFADAHGEVIHLGERDCSIQRRHQKVIEEAPSPFVTPDLRTAMGRAAIAIAKASGYEGAGTVEFLVDAERNFHFLEMNTRLQVEHPVTEAITGFDLVEWQIRVAAGEQLPIRQDDVSFAGHAIEVRLYAEDPAGDFAPQTGRVALWRQPTGAGVRVDHALAAGVEIRTHYDPMLAKIIAYGRTREEARRRLACALDQTVLLGLTTNLRFLREVTGHHAFVKGEVTTEFIPRDFAEARSMQQSSPTGMALALAALLFSVGPNGSATLRNPRFGWRNGPKSPIRFLISIDGETRAVEVMFGRQNNHVTVAIDAGAQILEILDLSAGRILFRHDGSTRTADYAFADGELHLDCVDSSRSFRNMTHQPAQSDNVQGDGRVLAPMAGAVIDITVAEGHHVDAGQVVAVIEAMKLEHQLKAPVSGKVRTVAASRGQQVKLRQLVIEISAGK